VIPYYLPTWFQVVKGVALASGVLTLPSVVSMAVGALVIGVLGTSCDRTFSMEAC